MTLLRKELLLVVHHGHNQRTNINAGHGRSIEDRGNEHIYV